MRLSFACTAFVLYASAGSAQIRLNQIQVIGSHNSYHAGLAPSEAALLQKRSPKSAAALEYRHPPLDVQLAHGVRQVELDVFADSKGGLYAHPAFVKMVADAGLPVDPPFDPAGLFKKPGFKVMHAQDVDYRSNCEPFTQCLSVILNWSKSHPGHLPLFVLIENKDGKPQAPYQVVPEEFTSAVFDALDKEILSVFPKNRIVTPDDVRGKHEILEQAILTDGWPSLESARGKVVFLLDQRRSGPAYLQGHTSLRGRVIFTNAEPGSPDAAFVEVNEPLKDPDLIPSLVRKGYLVRSRTDNDLIQPRTGDVRQRDAALASGAQILSTDFPFEERASWSGFAVSFPEGAIARCNPILKPAGCDPHSLTEPRP
jgi:hypothetical protein